MMHGSHAWRALALTQFRVTAGRRIGVDVLVKTTFPLPRQVARLADRPLDLLQTSG